LLFCDDRDIQLASFHEISGAVFGQHETEVETDSLSTDFGQERLESEIPLISPVELVLLRRSEIVTPV